MDFRLDFPSCRHSYAGPHPETRLPSCHHTRRSRSWEGPRSGPRSVTPHDQHHPPPGCQAHDLHHGVARGTAGCTRDQSAHCGFEVQFGGAAGGQPSSLDPSHSGSTEEAGSECGGAEGNLCGAAVVGGCTVSANLPHQPSHQNGHCSCHHHHHGCDH